MFRTGILSSETFGLIFSGLLEPLFWWGIGRGRGSLVLRETFPSPQGLPWMAFLVWSRAPSLQGDRMAR